jgi:hypothetical protein
VAGTALAIATLSSERVAVLTPDALRLFRFQSGRLVPLGTYPLPGPIEPVRFPGGLLLAHDDSIWLLRSGLPKAVLLAVDDRGGLGERALAEALPWPDCPFGLRYRNGTNLLEGAAVGLGDGPFLALLPSIAVDASGRLVVATATGPRPTELSAGPAVVSLGAGLFAAASADPPGSGDRILLLERDGEELRPVGSIPVAGAVRSLAIAANGRLLAAVETDGSTTLSWFDVERPAP